MNGYRKKLLILAIALLFIAFVLFVNRTKLDMEILETGVYGAMLAGFLGASGGILLIIGLFPEKLIKGLTS